MSTASPATILRDHTRLSVTSFDRLYRNGSVPTLQTPGQLVAFCRQPLGASIPSPALFGPLREPVMSAVHTYAEGHAVPRIRFRRGQRKDDVAAWHRARFRQPDGVVLIGIAQEQQLSFKATKRRSASGGLGFAFSRQPVAVNQVSFYVQDAEWGPAFVKIGTYLPYPVKVGLNGHHWAQQQLRRAGIAFDALDNGFRWCAAPERLQQLGDALGPADVQACFDRWLARLPWPLTPAHRAAGYQHRLSLWQVEVSHTQVFDEPQWGRRFFEQVIRDNLDLGRPDRVSLAFGAKLTRATPAPHFGYRTRVITAGVAPSLHVDFKHAHCKQYFKEGWALRTETTFNDPTDVQPTKALDTLPHLRSVGQQINARLLETEHLAAAAVPEHSPTERIQQPVLTAAGQRVAALRLSDQRVLALLQALCQVAPRPAGFRHRDLRPIVAQLLGRNVDGYSAGAMTYDLRRLRVHGLIERVPRSFRYTVTEAGLRLAYGISRIVLRLLQSQWQTLLVPCPEVPKPLHEALLQLDTALLDLRAAAPLASEPLALAA